MRMLYIVINLILELYMKYITPMNMHVIEDIPYCMFNGVKSIPRILPVQVLCNITLIDWKNFR